MHAAALGAELEVRKVIVPPLSGVFSAWGMLHDRAPRSTSSRRTSCAPRRLDRRRARRALRGARARGRARDARARGHGRAGEPSTARAPSTCATAARSTPCACRCRRRPISAARSAGFHEQHRRTYTFDLEDDAESSSSPSTSRARPRAARGGAAAPSARAASTPRRRSGRALVDFDVDGVHETAVLRAGGPADRLLGRRARS